jgi:2-dehydropantoate 2-reductase
MKIAIIGAGALGCLLASYLSTVAEVWLVDGWAEHVAAISSNGLLCETTTGERRSFPHATTDPTRVPICDVALITVKAHQTPWAAAVVQQIVVGAPPPLIVTLQNGLGNRETLASLLDLPVFQGVTALGATLLGPGRVRQAGSGATALAQTADDARLVRLVKLFNQGGLLATVNTQLDTLVWGKLLVNVGINALTALLRVPNGALSLPAVQPLLTAAVGEAVAVAYAQGIQLNNPDPLAHVLTVVYATAENHSSMLQDVLRGSPTEIQTINGAIVTLGAQLGVPTPVNQLLVQLVQALEATATLRV